jgi:Zn finger protein HypA/HybF involved in hydrogenase expression
MNSKFVVEVKRVMAKCQRCDYEWEPRQPVENVRMCPSCKSRLWKTPKPGKE